MRLTTDIRAARPVNAPTVDHACLPDPRFPELRRP